MASGLATGSALSLGILVTWQLLARDPAMQTIARAVEQRIAVFGLDDPARYLAFALFLSLLHSGLEEYYWRWFLLGGLRARTTAPRAGLLSALAFTSHHVVIVAGFVPTDRWSLVLLGSFGVLVAGVVWSWQYLRDGGVLSPWVSHALVDGAVLTLGWWLALSA